MDELTVAKLVLISELQKVEEKTYAEVQVLNFLTMDPSVQKVISKFLEEWKKTGAKVFDVLV
jgi:uncharacterized membrane protein YgcG